MFIYVLILCGVIAMVFNFTTAVTAATATYTNWNAFKMI